MTRLFFYHLCGKVIDSAGSNLFLLEDKIIIAEIYWNKYGNDDQFMFKNRVHIKLKNHDEENQQYLERFARMLFSQCMLADEIKVGHDVEIFSLTN